MLFSHYSRGSFRSGLPLLIFTILAQFSSGLFTSIFLTAYLFPNIYFGLKLPLNILMGFIWVMIALALLASIFHATANRLKVYKILFNLASPIGREVACTGFFFILVSSYNLNLILSFSLEKVYFPLNPVYDGVTMLAGLFMVAFMALAHLTPSKTFSEYLYTLSTFYSTVFLLGPLGIWVVTALQGLVVGMPLNILSLSSLTYCRWAILTVIVILIISNLFTAIYYSNLKNADILERFKRKLHSNVKNLLLAKQVLTAVSLALAVYILFEPIIEEYFFVTLVLAEFVFLFTQEVAGRMIFYKLIDFASKSLSFLTAITRCYSPSQRQVFS